MIESRIWLSAVARVLCVVLSAYSFGCEDDPRIPRLEERVSELRVANSRLRGELSASQRQLEEAEASARESERLCEISDPIALFDAALRAMDSGELGTAETKFSDFLRLYSSHANARQARRHHATIQRQIEENRETSRLATVAMGEIFQQIDAYQMKTIDRSLSCSDPHTNHGHDIDFLMIQAGHDPGSILTTYLSCEVSSDETAGVYLYVTDAVLRTMPVPPSGRRNIRVRMRIAAREGSKVAAVGLQIL